MRLIVLLLLTVLTVGCTCEQTAAFRKVWDGQMQKLYNWVPADTEAARYADKETEARAYLSTLRELPSPEAVSARMVADSFTWRAENIDYTSYAWVTIAAGKRGDCDDYMGLWEEILKFKGDTKKVTVTSTDGRAHAMLLFWHGDDVWLLSNMHVFIRGKRGDEAAMIRTHYGDKTDCFITY